MPYNRPGRGVYVTNGGTTITHGAPAHNAGFVGVAVKQRATGWDSTTALQDDIVASEEYFLITKGIVQVDEVAGFAKGDAVYIVAASNVLTETSAGNVSFGRVVEIEGQRGTPTNKVRIDLDLKA